MELSIFDIIKRPIITSKSVELFKKFGKITFEVHTSANKLVIRDAVEKIWGVKVDNVSTVAVPGKEKRFGRKAFKTSNRKKAIVTLKKGYKIEIPGMFEMMGAAETAPASESQAEGK